MLLFIEGYKYTLAQEVRNRSLRDILGDIFSIPKLEKEMEFKYVGYCYSHVAEDVVFFLPKVVLTDGKETVFGVEPNELIDFEAFSGKFNDGDERIENYKEFLSTLAIWIYRVLSVYKEKNNDNILENKETQTQSEGKKVKHNTLFDVIIALLDFNRENQDYLSFIARDTHSGNNKIQWTKSISKTQAIIQDDTPIYLNLVNKKKMINFDEELLIIFYSILNYISEEHGFRYINNLNFETIKPVTIKNRFIKAGYGKRRLKEIKYKYFSDKALRIWDLCYAFFVRTHEIAINKSRQDCLMAYDFDRVFEAMISELIGDSNLPEELTNQKDGKIIDHLFIERGLIESKDRNAQNTYYIGDSKYYKRHDPVNVNLDKKSIYKQFTYAKNIVQWNVDLFLGLNAEDYKHKGHHQLRDELTEGYNPIPNFFISAHIRDAQNDSNKLLAFDDDKITQQQRLNLNRQFENRLFDRDTLLLSHYDVNFLYIVALYGRNKKSAQAEWRDKVRKQFRKEIQNLLNDIYSFHVLQPRAGRDCYGFIKKHFSILNGKIYRPYPNANYLILAELKKEPSKKNVQDLWNIAQVKQGNSDEEVAAYEQLTKDIGDYFEITKNVKINADGGFSFDKIDAIGNFTNEKQGVLMVMMEKFADKSVNFLPQGKIAIGIKYTKDSMEIVEHLTDIGFLLFHVRKDEGQHLYKVNGKIAILPDEEIATDIYRNITTTKMYAVAEFEPIDLSSPSLHSSMKAYTPETRYDAQYAAVYELLDSN